MFLVISSATIHRYLLCLLFDISIHKLLFLVFRRSLLVLYGEPRYHWEHSILREDIASRRVCIAYRELTPTYLPKGECESMGLEILKMSKTYWDHYTKYSKINGAEQLVNGMH